MHRIASPARVLFLRRLALIPILVGALAAVSVLCSSLTWPTIPALASGYAPILLLSADAYAQAASTLRRWFTAACVVHPWRCSVSLSGALLYSDEGNVHDAAIQLRFPPKAVANRTAEWQRYIFAHQFPANCTGQKFYIAHHRGGNGATLHAHTMGLVAALVSGRIFDWNPAMWAHTDNVTCKDMPLNVECFLRRPTNCSVVDAPPEDVEDLNDNAFREVRQGGGV